MVEAAEVIAAKEEAAEASRHLVTDAEADDESSEVEVCPEEKKENDRLRRYVIRNRYDPRVLDLIEEYKELPEHETTPPAARIEEYELELDNRYLNDMRGGRIDNGQNLVALPIHLELYVLSRNGKVLRSYIESETLFGELIPQLYLMQEWDWHGEMKRFIWTGLVLLGGDTAELFIEAFHGTPLSSAVKCLGSALTRGPRPKNGDHLKPEECYVGDWLC